MKFPDHAVNSRTSLDTIVLPIFFSKFQRSILLLFLLFRSDLKYRLK